VGEVKFDSEVYW